MKLNCSLSVLCLLASLSTQAIPLQRTDIAADPTWLFHVDCDRLRGTGLGQYLVAEAEKPEAQGKFAAFQAMFKFDLRTQLHGLTIYSTGDSPEDAVLLVYADFDREHLATLAKGAHDYKESEHNQHVIHSWVDDSKRNRHGGRTYAATHGSRVLVFGQRESSVAKALDVFDLSAANLTASKTFPTLNSGPAFIQAAAQKLSISGSDPNAAVFRLSKSIRFEVGEEQKQVKATLQLTAGDEDVAKQIGSIGQGLIALIRLQKDRPEAGKLADSLTLKQDATDVTLTLSIPSAEAVDFMKAEAARREKKAE